MHVLFEITLHILKHALRDVQALHVDHDLPNSLVFIGLLLIFFAATLLRLFRLTLLWCTFFTVNVRCCRVERLLSAVGVIVFILAHDRVVDFGNGFKDNTTELALALGIFAAHKAEDFDNHPG